MKNGNYKRKSTIAWVATLVAILMLAVAVTAAITQGFSNWNPWGWFDKEEVCEHVYVDGVCSECGEAEPEDNGTPVTGEEGEELLSDAAIPMPSMMVFRSSTDLDGEDAAYDSVTLTATVKPDNASNKLVNWSVSFVNANSTWATGKTATDYVTVTPTSDGSTTATVQCLQAFGEQIKITVTSRSNADATASCTVDFAKRLTGFTMSIFTSDTQPSYDFINNDSAYTHITSLTSWIYLISPNATYSDYTVDDTFTFDIQYVIDNDLFNQFLTDKGLTGYTKPDISSVANDIAINGLSVPVLSISSLVLGITKDSDTAWSAASDAEFINILSDWIKENQTAELFRFDVTLTGEYSSVECYMPIIISSDNITYQVTGVELDQSNVII